MTINILAYYLSALLSMTHGNMLDHSMMPETCFAATIISTSGTYSCDGPATGNGCNDCTGATHADWYVFTPTCGGTISMSTCGQAANTRLHVYQGSCDGLVKIATYDDECISSGSNNHAVSVQDLEVWAGTNYYFEWDNRWSSAAFDFEFTYDNFCDCKATSTIAYVNETATGHQTGCDWSNAFTDLPSAIESMQEHPSITEIWVSQGTYYPTSGTDRSVSFEITRAVSIYGGFSGTETMKEQRNAMLHECILSADIDKDETIANNSYHLLEIPAAVTGVVIDGFQLTEALADGNATMQEDRGAGIYCLGSAELHNIIFELCQSNYDGASIFLSGNNAQLLLNNVTSTANEAGNLGNTVAVENGATLLLRGSNAIE